MTASIRFLLSGPASSIFRLPSGRAQQWIAPRGSGFLAKLGIPGIVVLVLRLLFGVQLLEIAEKLVESVVGGQMLDPVAQGVFAKLAGGVALLLQQTGDRRILFPQAELRAW